MKGRNADSQKPIQIFKIILPAALLPVLLFFTILLLPLHTANSQESAPEPYISLNVLNQPLGEVLNKITQDTGYTFKLKEEWQSFPINVSIQNLPLNQGLKRILASLNHAIIYEAEKKIHILVYGRMDVRGKDSHPTQSTPSLEPAEIQESAPSAELIPEDTEEVRSADESTEETEAVEETAERTPSDQESSSPTENSEEPTDQTGPPTDAASDDAQNQN